MASRSNPRTRKPTLRSFRRLGSFLLPYRARFVVAGVALLVAAGCTLAVGQGLKLVIDRGFAANDGGALDQALVALLAIIAVMAVATYVRFYNVSWIGERVTADLRRACLRSPADALARLLRDHAHRRSHLAPHQRHDDARDA